MNDSAELGRAKEVVMMLDMKRVVIDVEYRGILPIGDAAGTQIDCLQGWIWITEQGCAGDIVLEAGESYEISRSGVAVVQALREAVIALRAPAPSQDGAALASSVERLWSRRTAGGMHTFIAQPGRVVVG
jgi:hypothetical protein